MYIGAEANGMVSAVKKDVLQAIEQPCNALFVIGEKKKWGKACKDTAQFVLPDNVGALYEESGAVIVVDRADETIDDWSAIARVCARARAYENDVFISLRTVPDAESVSTVFACVDQFHFGIMSAETKRRLTDYRVPGYF
jgi:hypothetical protein